MKNDKYDIEVKLLAITGLSQQDEDIARGKTLPPPDCLSRDITVKRML